MSDISFDDALKLICSKDTRYEPDAYYFVSEGLTFTAKSLNRPRQGAGRHISGPELLEGIRAYAIQEFGPMALTVLRSWGVNRTDDFGEIVFNLVESGKLGKTDQDKREDFSNGYDFVDAFGTPFLPQNTATSGRINDESGGRSDGRLTGDTTDGTRPGVSS
jgi:uncharacterized repeat protein (TIGR04138 family)